MAAKTEARGNAALDEVTADIVKAAQAVAKVTKAAVEVVVERVSKKPRVMSAKKKAARSVATVKKKGARAAGKVAKRASVKARSASTRVKKAASKE